MKIKTLICSRNIINILIGDTPEMPYLSGPDLTTLLNTFGISTKYPLKINGISVSRWKYLELLFNSITDYNAVLTYLFKIENFKNMLTDCDPEEIENEYMKLINEAFKQINKELFYSNMKIYKKGKKVSIVDLEKKGKPKKVMNDYYDEISLNLNEGYYSLSLNEKLEALVNILENKLKVNNSFMNISNEYIKDDIIRSFRKNLQCYRHHTEKDISKRNSHTKPEKEYWIHLGETIIIQIRNYKINNKIK